MNSAELPLQSNWESSWYRTQTQIKVDITNEGDVTVQMVSKNIFQRIYNAWKGKDLWLTSRIEARYVTTDTSREKNLFQNLLNSKLPLKQMRDIFSIALLHQGAAATEQMKKEPQPPYLYKVLSLEAWENTKSKNSVILSTEDSNFIHFSKKDQLE